MESYSFRQDIGCNTEALPGVLGNRGKRTLIQGEQRPVLRGTKTILGNRKHKKASFRFLGSRGTNNLFQGTKEQVPPSFPPPGGPQQLRQGRRRRYDRTTFFGQKRILVCGVFCEFVTFPLVSWVRCGT